MPTTEKTLEKTLKNEGREYGSGDVVEPGLYVDIETGATVLVREPDELPEGSRVIRYRRRFQRVEDSREKTPTGLCAV